MEEERKATGVPVGKSALAVLFLVVFLDNLGFAIVLPYLYFYASALGASVFVYGVLLASYSLMSFIFTPIVARLSDRFGRRRILLYALAVSSFGYFIFGAGQTLWVLFAARMLSGTTAATVPVAQAYVADVTTSKNRLRYMGLLGAAAGLAFILGPAIGGTLSHYFGFGVPSFLASALAFGNLLSAYFRLPEPSRDGVDRERSIVSFRALRDILTKQQINLLLAVYFLFFVSFMFLQAALSPWLQSVFGFNDFGVGVLFFYIGGVSVFTQAVLLPKLSKNRSRSTLTLIGIVTLTAGLFVLAVVVNFPLLFAVTAVISFGFGLQIVTLNTLISVNTPGEAQGGTLGIAWALAALAQTASPVLATSTYTLGVARGFVGLVFVVSAVISLATIPFVLKFKRVAGD